MKANSLLKKLIILTLVIMMVSPVLSCSSAPASFDWEETTPWGTNTAYERCTYEASIYSRKKVSGVFVNDKLLAKGEYISELTQVIAEGIGTVTLTTKLTLTYQEDADEKDRGLKDTIISEVKFNQIGCAPISSYKYYEMASRKNSNGSYEKNYGYTYKANYSNARNAELDLDPLKAEIKNIAKVDENGEFTGEYEEEKLFSLKSGILFDNEQLYYVARALANVKSGGSVSISQSNIYDIYKTRNNKNGKYSLTPISLTTSSDKKEYTLEGDFMQNYMDLAEGETEYKFNCISTVIHKNDKLPGPDTTLLITDPATIFTNKDTARKTSKIIYQISNIRYDQNTLNQKTIYTATLSDYVSAAAPV